MADDMRQDESRETLLARIQELRRRVAAAERRATEEQRRADRVVDAANRRGDAYHVALGELRAEIQAQRTLTAEIKARFDKTNRNLVETNRELKRTNNLLTWKSMTSTKNPVKLELTHQFLITGGRKKITNDELVHVPKEGRQPITRTEVPQLNQGEFVRVNVHSIQNRTIEDALKLREEKEEWEIQRGYIAGGIDFRQNFKAAGKRRFGDDEPLLCRYDWRPDLKIPWEDIWTLLDCVRITTVRKPEEIDLFDDELAKEGLLDFEDWNS